MSQLDRGIPSAVVLMKLNARILIALWVPAFGFCLFGQEPAAPSPESNPEAQAASPVWRFWDVTLPPGDWQPAVGDQTLALFRHVPAHEEETPLAFATLLKGETEFQFWPSAAGMSVGAVFDLDGDGFEDVLQSGYSPESDWSTVAFGVQVLLKIGRSEPVVRGVFPAAATTSSDLIVAGAAKGSSRAFVVHPNGQGVRVSITGEGGWVAHPFSLPRVPFNSGLWGACVTEDADAPGELMVDIGGVLYIGSRLSGDATVQELGIDRFRELARRASGDLLGEFTKPNGYASTRPANPTKVIWKLWQKELSELQWLDSSHSPSEKQLLRSVHSIELDARAEGNEFLYLFDGAWSEPTPSYLVVTRSDGKAASYELPIVGEFPFSVLYDADNDGVRELLLFENESGEDSSQRVVLIELDALTKAMGLQSP